MPKSPTHILEKTVEQRVVRWAKSKGILAIKLNGIGQRSNPDRLFVGPFGTCAFIELKRPGNEPTQLQYSTLSKLNNAGHCAEWFDDADECIEYLERIFNC